MFGWFSAPAARASCSKRREPVGVGGERRGQHLDRDLAAEPRVARAVDLAHPAGAERRDDLVGPQASAGHHPASLHLARICPDSRMHCVPGSMTPLIRTPHSAAQPCESRRRS